ncbi:MAG: FAD-binding oxidoreductase [Candidatus Marinimicrobia bacterium]|nr:FAD-binding oxidoreductase [Candidatus Neomarinimicrobiota bacterium]
MKKFDVVIIGAGSIGVPLSFYLANRGLKVAILEKLPSTGRGQNRAAIGGIRATFSDPAKIKICLQTIEIMKNMKVEHGLDVDWIQGGYLYPAYDEKTEIAFKQLLDFQKQYKLNNRWITPDEIDKLVPGINRENLRGGNFSEEDGSASPLKTTAAFSLLSHRRGTELFFDEEVRSMKIEKRKIVSVETSRDVYSADIFINASGADAKTIGALARADIPIYTDCHEAGVTEAVERFFEPMVVDIRPDGNSSNYYFYQNAEGQVVFCITPEPKIIGADIDNTSTFLPLVVKRMVQLYPRLRHLRVRRTWRGLYPMTPDGFPIVGFTKEVDNFFLTVGMCGQGYMIGPGLGKIVSEILVDKTNRHDEILTQLTLYRKFTGNEMLK